MNDETQDNEIVNEILSEIDHQNMKGNPTMTNNSNIFQRNVDIYKKINKEESKTEVEVTLEENTYEMV